MSYFRPLVQQGGPRPEGALPLAGGRCWFTHAQQLTRGAPPCIIPAQAIPAKTLERLTASRAALAGLTLDVPRLMGILNVTPDSFSDGGVHFDSAAARTSAVHMVEQGATLLDIGGESTRPGAAYVPPEDEIARTVPAISAIRGAVGAAALISIDTRKASVAQAAVAAGAGLVNDVSGFTFDPALAPFCAQAGLPVCIMHAQGSPQTMQADPRYDDVLLDVYDFLEAQVARLEALGLYRSQIVIDPGIGFGKTVDHNLTLLRNISLFHAIGCPILLGVSRKGFIGRLGAAPQADQRAPGSIAVGLAALGQGVQILRVHDVAETAQALRLWLAVI